MIWEPGNFEIEKTSVWSFPERGSWATHDGKWRGNWSPYVPRNIILRYSKEQDTVLDQFVGGGTTLVEAKLLNRNAIGVDVNEKALARCREKTAFSRKDLICFTELKKGDARDLSFLRDESIDLICTHPPYADIIKYSAGEDISEDLSNLAPERFLSEMKKVAAESWRVLKPERFCCVLIGDIRRNGYVTPLGFQVLTAFEEAGFRTKEIVIKEQHNCKSTSYWEKRSEKCNFLLLAHEYLFVLKK